MTEQQDVLEPEVTRSEAAEYVHDMAGQLATMARLFGLQRVADALLEVQRAVEAEF